MGTEQLRKESQIYDSHIDTWRTTHQGEFVLIKEDEVIGFYSSLGEAFKEGTQRFGLDNFFIKQIIPRDTVNVSLLGRRLRTA